MKVKNTVSEEGPVILGVDTLRSGAQIRCMHGILVARPMSCMPGYFEIINPHTVGSLTIPRASIKWV